MQRWQKEDELRVICEMLTDLYPFRCLVLQFFFKYSSLFEE